MKIVSRSRGTKIILEENDIATLRKDGKLSGGYKGHRYLVTSPPSPTLGVSEEIHNSTAEQLVESKKTIIELQEQKATIGATSDELLLETASLKETIEEKIDKITELDGEYLELENKAKRLQKAAKKFKKLYDQAVKDDQDTIPIKEHEDLMSAKVQAHNQAVEVLEDDQENKVNELEDEIGKLKEELEGCSDALSG